MQTQFLAAIRDPKKLKDTAVSKRSPFKKKVSNSEHHVDTNLGSTAVALPDGTTDFGRRFAEVIHRLQDLAWEALDMQNCIRQTMPHMSIGSVVLDRETPEQYNEAVQERRGQLAKVRAYLDAVRPPRARIQTLKVNPDGCVTFQLERDEGQDTVMTEKQLLAAIAKVPTCSTEEAAAAEKKKFTSCGEGRYKVSHFQRIRLELGAMGCDIKGMWPAGHMVLFNLVNATRLAKIEESKLVDLWTRFHAIWSPLAGEWFDLHQIVVLVYVERSLNEGNVVRAPVPGGDVEGYPPGRPRPAVFRAEANGDVFIDLQAYERRMEEHAKAMWQDYRGELRAIASGMSPEELHHDKIEAIALSFAKILEKYPTDEAVALKIQRSWRGMRNQGQRGAEAQPASEAQAAPERCAHEVAIEGQDAAKSVCC